MIRIDQKFVLGDIPNRIHTVRGVQVMLDSDLAILYGVSTMRLNEQVKRNKERFPEKYCFRLTKSEITSLISQIAISNKRGGRRKLPYVFTEQGVAMLSAVLHSDVAVHMSIRIMDAFVSMRKMFYSQTQLLSRLNTIESRQTTQQIETDRKFEQVFNALSTNEVVPRQKIFFEGEVFDAHVFVAKIIKSAQKEIILIDSFIDESVLLLFTKRRPKVISTIYTRNITQSLSIDIEKHNAQYPPILVKEFALSHDRFLIIDQKEVYHFGASLKDLGKKWFAVSKIDETGLLLLKRLTKLHS